MISYMGGSDGVRLSARDRTTQRQQSGVPAQPPAPALGKALTFLQALWKVAHELQSLSKRMDSTVGVTGPQRMALRIIGRQPGVTAGNLAAVLRLSPGTMTGVLRRLESRGFVLRREDATDGRRALLFLTPLGEMLAERRTGTVEGAVRRALLKLDAHQYEVAARALELVASELEIEIESGSGERGDSRIVR